MPDPNPILLQTKPRRTHNLVVRTRLLEVLNHVIDHQLTMACALIWQETLGI